MPRRLAYDPDRAKVIEWLKMAEARKEAGRQEVVVNAGVPVRPYAYSDGVSSPSPQVTSAIPEYTGQVTSVISEYPGVRDNGVLLFAGERLMAPKNSWTLLNEIDVANVTTESNLAEIGMANVISEQNFFGPLPAEAKTPGDPPAAAEGSHANASPPASDRSPLAPETVGRVEQSFTLARWCRIPAEFIEDAMGDVLESLVTGRVDAHDYRRLVLSWMFRLVCLSVSAVWHKYVRGRFRAK
jgi:hypothetical protein